MGKITIVLIFVLGLYTARAQGWFEDKAGVTSRLDSFSLLTEPDLQGMKIFYYAGPLVLMEHNFFLDMPYSLPDTTLAGVKRITERNYIPRGDYQEEVDWTELEFDPKGNLAVIKKRIFEGPAKPTGLLSINITFDQKTRNHILTPVWQSNTGKPKNMGKIERVAIRDSTETTYDFYLKKGRPEDFFNLLSSFNTPLAGSHGQAHPLVLPMEKLSLAVHQKHHLARLMVDTAPHSRLKCSRVQKIYIRHKDSLQMHSVIKYTLLESADRRIEAANTYRRLDGQFFLTGVDLQLSGRKERIRYIGKIRKTFRVESQQEEDEKTWSMRRIYDTEGQLLQVSERKFEYH